MSKKFIIVSVTVLTFTATILMLLFGKNLLPVVFLGCLPIFLAFSLWSPPKKHKTFSYADQQKATARALGGSGPPELPEPLEGKRLKPQN